VIPVDDYNLGCSVQLDDDVTLTLLEDLYREDAIGHIQVQIVPLPRPTFRDRIAAVAATAIPTAIHAPHHSHGVNPCAPAAYDDRPLPEIEEYIEEAMAQTYEAADALGAEVIVLHAGRYLPGERAAAEDEFPNFLDRYSDPRLALENLPAVYAGYPLLGNTAHDLRTLAGTEITRFCLDFPHLACTTNYQNLSFTEELERFESLNVTLHHLSNIRRGSITDEHLELDHPDGGLDVAAVFARLRRHHTTPTTLEYKDDVPAVYTRQTRVFGQLWEEHARSTSMSPER
jgi:sugar phosphate isomerase/epimerase